MNADDASRLFFDANVRLLENDFGGAADLFADLLDWKVDHPAVLHNLALALECQSEYEGALEAYQENIAAAPAYVRSYLGAANCARALGDLPRCIDFLSRAQRVGLGWPQLNILVSEVLFLVGLKDYNRDAIEAHCMGLAYARDRGSKLTRHYTQCYYDSGTESVYHMYDPGSLLAAPPPSLDGRLDFTASMTGRVTVMVINRGYVDLARNCVASMRRNAPSLFKQLVVFCLDEETWRQMNGLVPYAVLCKGLVPVAPACVPATYNTPYFSQLVATKVLFVQALLQRGLDVLFTDADVVWLKEPGEELLGAPRIFQADLVRGDQDEQEAPVCTGLFAVTACEDNVELFDYRYIPPTCGGEQPVVNYLLDVMELSVRRLSKSEYPNGQARLCSSEPVAVHYNYMLGLDKATAMKDSGHWYLDVPRTTQERIVEETRPFRPPPHTHIGYSGPWVENAYFEHFMNTSGKNERSVYLPILWTDVATDHPERLTEIAGYLDRLPRGRSYYTVIQTSTACDHLIPPDLDLLVFAAGTPHHATPDNRVRCICIPLLSDQTGTPKPAIDKGRCCFAGTCDGISDHKGLRSEMATLPGLTLYKGPAWREVISQHRFSLCPRGYGPTSFRVSESLLLGSVPVIIWEDDLFLPYVDELDWSKFSLVVERGKLWHIPALLDAADPAALAATNEILARFTYKGVCEYIASRV